MRRLPAAAGAALLLLSPVVAEAGDPAARYLAQAEEGCTGLDDGVLTVLPGYRSAIELAPGVEAIVLDDLGLSCSTAPSSFCGSAGCAVTLIVGEEVYRTHARDWTVMETTGGPVVLFELHGMACEAWGSARCASAVVWSDGVFRFIHRRKYDPTQTLSPDARRPETPARR